MALFTGVQHLCTFNIVPLPLIYPLLPNVWKVSYTIRASIFVDVLYWWPYSTDKFISCVVLGPSQWFFHFGEEIVIAWTHRVIVVDVPESPIANSARGPWQKQRCDFLHCHEEWWGSVPQSASHSPWKYSCVPSIVIQEHCSSFVNMVLGLSHHLYESQRSTHCSRLTEYCRNWLH